MSKSLVTKIGTFSKPAKGTLLLFLDSNGKPADEILAYIKPQTIEKLVSVSAFKAKRFETVNAVMSDDEGFDRLVLVGTGDMSKFNGDDWLRLGGAARAAMGDTGHVSVMLAVNSVAITEQDATDFICGMMLRSYHFDKYKTIKKDEGKTSPKITLQLADTGMGEKAHGSAFNLARSVILARNLVNEPANVLGTEEFAAEIEKLEKYGLKIEIHGEKELKKMGANAILAVARGSVRPPRLVVMTWNGGKSKDAPIAFVGKGVVFDTGGISLKPGAGMEDMKGDMGGAAAVVGAMRTLAERNAPVNAIGVVGLVENMPDGNAQRPGDIITTMSGQTVEVINTDAEGRLVLADALWFTKEKFKPKLMVDFATLTGAIMVALGQHYAGLFANDDVLADHIVDAGRTSGERVWRMPLGEEYDKIVDSKFADMRNSTGRLAGAVCAAQFLQRFVGDTPWAHIDIAGTAIDAAQHEYNQSWASGYGVRLLDRLVADYYEE